MYTKKKGVGNIKMNIYKNMKQKDLWRTDRVIEFFYKFLKCFYVDVKDQLGIYVYI